MRARVALALLLLAAPAAAQETLRVQHEVRLTELARSDLVRRYEYDDAGARDFRGLADTDRDGVVSAEERAANEAPYAEQYGPPGQALPFALDGVAYVTVEGARADSIGLEGPVGQRGPLRIFTYARAALNGTAADAPAHAWTRAALPHEAIPERVEVWAPRDWRVESAPGAEAGECRAVIPAEQRGEVRVQLAAAAGACRVQETVKTPGPGPAALLVVLAAAAGAARAGRCGAGAPRQR